MTSIRTSIRLLAPPVLASSCLLFGCIAAFGQQATSGAEGSTDGHRADAAQTVSLADYCEDSAGRADCGPGIARWVAAVLSSGKCGFIPPGRYRSTTPITVDITAAAERGICIEGSGRNASIFDLTGVAASPAMSFVAKRSTFYSNLHDWGVAGNTPGTVLQIGRSDFSDAWNTVTLDRINVNNASKSPKAVTMQINFVLNAHLDLTVNGSGSGNPHYPSAPGVGTALQIRQLQFSVAKVSAANARVAMQLTAGAIYSNSFPGLDLEEAETGLLIDGASVANNQLSGTIVASYPIRATAGVGNVVTDFSPGIYTGGKLFAGPPVGVTLVEKGQGAAATPAFPESGAAYLNDTGRPYMVYAAGSGLKALTIKKSYGQVFNLPGVNGTAPTTFMLNPMDAVTTVWANSRPTWQFVPAD